jgi:hypothetical protein
MLSQAGFDGQETYTAITLSLKILPLTQTNADYPKSKEADGQPSASFCLYKNSIKVLLFGITTKQDLIVPPTSAMEPA